MQFTYDPEEPLSFTLMQAKDFARDQKRVVRFTCRGIHFWITPETNLGLAWCEYWSVKPGEVVGPCAKPYMTMLRPRPQVWRHWSAREQTLAANLIQRLQQY